MRNTTTLTSLVIQILICILWLIYVWLFQEASKLAATFATKWVNTKLLDYVPENKIRVRMSLMPEKMRAILENGTSPNKEFSSWRSFSKQDTLRTSISVQLFTTTKNWAGTKNSSTSLTTKYQRSLKNKPVSNVFSLLTMLIFTK
jgi:hypothetical protein